MSEVQSEVKAPVSGNKLSADDVNDLFKTIDTEKPEEKTTKPDKEIKEDKETKELPEDEDEIELKEVDEDEEEKLDLESDDDVTIDAPPRKQELLKKYPDLFKDFKFLEKMLYRDKQYSELFGSFDDAKEIAEKSEIFNNFEKDLLSGKTEEILKNVKETDSKAFDKIVDSYLQTLAKVDKDAYFEVVGNIGKQMILEMVKEANESQDDRLKEAALLLNQFLFSTSKFVPPKQRTNEKENEQSETEKERLSYVQERFETATNDLQGKVDNILRSTISNYIDPKDVMSGYVKKNAISDALKIVHNSIGADTGLRKNLDRLWRAATDDKFSKESLGRIQSFYLGKAKGSLPSAIKKARAEALKDLAPRVKNEEIVEDEKEERTSPKKGNIPPGRPSQPKKTEMKRGETVAEFFGRD